MADWTPLRVEERIVEAAEVLRRLPEEKVRGYFGVWPEVVHDFADKVGQEPLPMRRPPPSSASISRMDETLPWLAWLEPKASKIIWLRASGERWKTICWTVGLQRSAAHQHWLYGLCVISLKLNRRRFNSNLSKRRVIELAGGAGIARIGDQSIHADGFDRQVHLSISQLSGALDGSAAWTRRNPGISIDASSRCQVS